MLRLPCLKYGFVRYAQTFSFHSDGLTPDQVLQQAEAERWRGTTTPYNPLLVHTTLPIILYENQRLDLRLKTVATSGGRPKFSASGLGKRGRRAPFELKLPRPDEETGIRLIPASKNGVHLPFRDAYWDIPRPVNIDRPNLDNTERSHFWLYASSNLYSLS